jgi:hypothetical protein
MAYKNSIKKPSFLRYEQRKQPRAAPPRPNRHHPGADDSGILILANFSG